MTRCRFPAILSILGCLLLAAAACTYASAEQGEPEFATEFSPGMLQSIRETAMSQIPAGFELPERGDVALANGVLKQAVAADAGEGEFPQGLAREGGSVKVEILHNLTSEEIADLVTSLGGNVYGEVPGILAEALVPIDSLVELEAHEGVEYVRPPLAASEEPRQPPGFEMAAPEGFTGFHGQEVVKTNADAWQDMGYTGQGVKFGIIDSFDAGFWNAAQAAGEVLAPSGTFCMLGGVPCDIFDTFGSPHGTAVAEIIHEQAPDAQLYLASAYTASDLQAVVDYFAANGVDIISRSETAEYDGPGDGTGPIATVMNNAISQGMTWFNAAGNAAGTGSWDAEAGFFTGGYWRSNWIDSHDPPGDGYLGYLDNPLGGDFFPFICGFVNGVRWNDWGGNRTDYDVFVFDDVIEGFGPIGLKTSSIDDQQGNPPAPPIENFNLDLTCGDSPDVDWLAIGLFDTGSGTGGDIIEFMTNTAMLFWNNPYSASGPMSDTNSPGGLSVGAIDPANGTTIAPYSSWGPTNDGRITPTLSGAACVYSMSYAPDCFNGTSSAAPAVSGAAALVLGAGMSGRTTPAGVDLPTTPAQLKTYLLNEATIDRGAAGPDNIYGAGELVLPDPPPAGPTNTPTPIPTGGGTPTATPTPTPTGGPTVTPTPSPTPTPPPGSNAVKKLFNGRWDKPLIGNDYGSWMDLTLSPPYYECDGGARDAAGDTAGGFCANKWSGPVMDAIDDWNAQQTTVRFMLQPVQSDDHDVHIVIADSVLGDPSLLGLAVFYDDDFNECNPQVCDWSYGDALVGDDAHTGDYSGSTDRQATTAHEVGHLLSLRHESTNASETALFDCGFDDTGPIPHSVMAYDCIDPVSIGGAGEYWVQPFDVCGVNAAYLDPNVGMAGCLTGGATPTPTPTPQPDGLVQGDNDCDGDEDAVDALASLQKNAGLQPNQQPGCPELNSALPASVGPQLFGDIDCDGDVDAVDSLQILRHVAGLGANQEPGCPAIGSPIGSG